MLSYYTVPQNTRDIYRKHTKAKRKLLKPCLGGLRSMPVHEKQLLVSLLKESKTCCSFTLKIFPPLRHWIFVMVVKEDISVIKFLLLPWVLRGRWSCSGLSLIGWVSSMSLPPMVSITSSVGTLLKQSPLELVSVTAAFSGLSITSQSALVFAKALFFNLPSFLIKMCGTESSSVQK